MRHILQSVILGSLLLNPTLTLAVDENLAPESATGLLHQTSIKVDQELVVTAHPLATQAGYNILKQGGSAADAAVAVQAMLTLVEPQSSGLGGGAFMLYWDNVNQQLHALDGRETAPANADEKLFLAPDGKPMKWWDAMVGGRSVGTPGVLAMLNLGQEQFGKLTWNKLFNRAIDQAEQGFEVSPRLHQLLADKINPGLGRYKEAKDYFFTPAGEPLPTGYLLKNPKLAKSLRQIAKQGTKSFYQGEIASQIISSVKSAEDNPGKLSIKDMASYQPKFRQPLCMPFRLYRVCGFPPPTSGGVTALQILKLLERFSNEQLQPGTISQSQLFTQASRLAYADRARYLADSDFVDVPVKALLDSRYLQQRSQLISTTQDMGKAEAGQPELALSQADDRSPELPSTSHFVILDKWGNAVSMTSSIEMAFGSTLMAGGFLLNNQLTDFSFIASQDGKPIANRVEAGKRPRSSMSPIMIFDQDNQLIGALGSPGGSRIISYVAESLLMKLTSDLSLQQIFERPHIVNRNGTTELEAGTSAEQLEQPLQELGHEIKVRDLNSGLHGFYRSSNGQWESAVDPRREGSAIGN